MTNTIVIQIQILMKTLMALAIYITIIIIGIITVVHVKSMSFDAGREECLFVCLTLGYVMDELIVMMGK